MRSVAVERSAVGILPQDRLCDVQVNCVAEDYAGAVATVVPVGLPTIQPGVRWYPMVKRAVDVVVAVVLVIMLLPLMCAVALLIRLTSPGPALFRQERIKQHGASFTMYKFRSMRVDADPRVHHEAIRR